MDEAREIAKQAYLYGFPMVEAYKTLYAQAVETDGPNYRAPFNTIGNAAQVFTPKDTAIVTPNSDTPYSMMWMDLRAEPLVLQHGEERLTLRFDCKPCEMHVVGKIKPSVLNQTAKDLATAPHGIPMKFYRTRPTVAAD